MPTAIPPPKVVPFKGVARNVCHQGPRNTRKCFDIHVVNQSRRVTGPARNCHCVLLLLACVCRTENCITMSNDGMSCYGMAFHDNAAMSHLIIATRPALTTCKWHACWRRFFSFVPIYACPFGAGDVVHRCSASVYWRCHNLCKFARLLFKALWTSPCASWNDSDIVPTVHAGRG